MSPFLEAAAALTAGGYHIIPLPAGQKAPPPTGWTGEDGATADAAQIVQWAATAGNIGIRLPRNVVGIDVDAYGDKPGMQTYAELVKQHGAPPRTVLITSRDDTVSGIRLFRLPAEVDYRQLVGGLPGIEVLRWNHRYAVAPPSMHPNGAPYRALDTQTRQSIAMPAVADLPLLPDAWIAALTPPPRAERVQPASIVPHEQQDAFGEPCKAMRGALERAWQGGNSRHDQLTAAQLAVLRLDDMGHAGAERALEQLASQFIGAVTADGARGDREVEAEVRRGVDGARAVIDRSPFTGQRGCCGDASTISLPSISELVGGNVVQNVGSQPPIDVPAADVVPPTRLEQMRGWLLTAEALDEIPEPEPVIAGHLYRDTLVELYGKPGGGKSFLALDWAMSVATGHRWQDEDVEQGPVIYIVGEGLHGLGKRRRAWTRGWRPERGAQIRFMPRAIPILDPAWLTPFAELAAEIRPSLIVVDTVSRAIAGHNENDSQVMSALVAAGDKLKHAGGGSCVLLVHHSTKEGSTNRGHSALEGACDVRWRLEGDASELILRNEKSKDDAPRADRALALSVVEMPGGITSCVVRNRREDSVSLLSATKAETDVLCHAVELFGSDPIVQRVLTEACSGLSERGVYRAKQSLKSKGYMASVGTVNRQIWRVTATGVALASEIRMTRTDTV